MPRNQSNRGNRKAEAFALSRPDLNPAIATNCFLLALLLFETGYGLFAPWRWWFAASALLAGTAAWLGTRFMRVAALSLLAALLLLASSGLFHHARVPGF